MIFKHLNLYRLEVKVDQARLDDFLDENPFEPCLPSQERSAGFSTIVGLDRRVFATGGILLFCLVIQEKIIPAAAVKAEFQKALQLKEKEGIRLKREEKKALKEVVREGMLPRAFAKTPRSGRTSTTSITCWQSIHPRAKTPMAWPRHCAV